VVVNLGQVLVFVGIQFDIEIERKESVQMSKHNLPALLFNLLLHVCLHSQFELCVIDSGIPGMYCK
jgi:hypothetical protein